MFHSRRLKIGGMRELYAVVAFVERQFNLCKRYWTWELVFLFYTVINTLTIAFIAVGMQKQGHAIQPDYVFYLVIGALMWGFLGIIFHEISNSISWERWEGTIEQTFMAPVQRLTHLGGVCSFAVLYGLLRTGLVLVAMTFFFGMGLPKANYAGALLVLGAASLSFIGLGLMAAILPLLSPEKGSQATHIMEGVLLLVSGIYYPVEALPEWLQSFAIFSPATYALEGVRKALLQGAGVAELWPLAAKLLLMSLLFVPLGLGIFHTAETYAKRAGLLKRNG
ncbi:ABC transporter [bacterium (Candidatus Blackallbacteria) CG17_big_fil_post_rev_8_21_14_2_50_48_46]|uniref:Transport permease protein n=1 Tax=bacterium (Candidatus Blackallbacteria) CG17_big_fil_post_rev_8_21_14_2_50_48_46 TaxID=2014261 RepID=A0A2M7GAV7_9BACT|nr:MAG: ABC transporter [bacterium (Candidatus Blackallbacteria) CG18_big_fil_WC_8_21_14_2_50_49_26]PIW19312.1 MAG: ABC transporter [bacterium (Candidatus Blackallbacteria) CG17_big_fil_post_rev_8_21_14_2_50_48_46]PIW49084.1 MAG: ABC transporter [bacterium (Candidatus Blackallbacteria) CG13_big_fil_rev_8_21_14_2_50_49_14]